MIEKNSKILITGGAGFIGTHLTNCLLSKGFTNITVIDIVKPKTNKVKFVCSDFSDFNVIEKNLKGVDYVFHLAAMVGVDKCRLNPEKVKEVNATNAKNFIDLCVKNKIKRLIFTSSSEVYGNSKEIPYKENAKLEPISEYAKSKVSVENYLKQVQSVSGMTVGIVRFFNVYGPGQRKDFVVPGFIDKALHDKPLTILGDGKQIRCFTFVGDAVEGVYKLLIYDKNNYEIFNIGNSRESTINDLAKTILNIIPDSKSKIVYQEYGGGIRDSKLEITRRVPDVSKAKSLLDFEAKTTLSEGIKRIIKQTLDEK